MLGLGVPEERICLLHLAATLVTPRMLIRRAAKRHRWDDRPATRRLK
jgi:hypothetical protein